MMTAVFSAVWALSSSQQTVVGLQHVSCYHLERRCHLVERKALRLLTAVNKAGHAALCHPSSQAQT